MSRPSATPLRVRVEALDEEGAGLARTADGLTLHVPLALPGEAVTVAVEHVSPHRGASGRAAWGRLIDREGVSPDRTPPPCPVFGICGGCNVQHLATAAQLAWKRGRVVGALAAAGIDVNVDDVRPSPRAYAYRNHAKLVWGRVEGRLALGSYRPRTHDLVDMRACQVVEPAIAALLPPLRDALEKTGLEPYDEATGGGELRYVLVRANAAGALLVTFVSATFELDRYRRLAEDLRTAHPNIVGIVVNHNAARGNALLGTREAVVSGLETVDDAVGVAPMTLTSRAFFQLNRDVATIAYRRIADAVAALGTVDVAVDAYAGAGAIAFHLAPHARSVVGVESNPAAVEAARQTTARLGHTHLRFVVADAGAGLGSLARADVVVLNPPRSGCRPEVLAEVQRLTPRMVAYLSCDPRTLARDLAILGFEIVSITPFDMLPQTAHVETLALLNARRPAQGTSGA